MPEIEVAIASETRMKVEEFAKKLSSFFMEEWNKRPELKDYKGVPIILLIGGFDEGELHSHTYELHIPFKPEPFELPQIGISLGGQRELVERLIRGFDPNLPQLLKTAWALSDEQLSAMPQIAQSLELNFALNVTWLQGYIDLAILLIHTTIEFQRLTNCVRGCGGPIDVATITRREGLRYVQHKEPQGEFY